MKGIIAGFVMLVAASAIALGQTTSGNGAEQAAVRHVEDAITVALDHNDAAALEQLWSSDYTFVNPGGVLMTKAQRLAAIRSGAQQVESYSRDQETIRVYGATAIVTYRSTVRGHFRGEGVSNQRRVTTVLLKQNGRWQPVAQQSTVIFTNRNADG